MLFRVFLALLAVSLIAHASLFSNQHNSGSSKHALLAHRVASNGSQASLKKRCKPREKTSLLSSARPAETSKAKLAPVVAAPAKATPTKAAPVKVPSATVHHAASQVPGAGSVSSAASGLLRVTSPICGPSGATKDITVSSGPNGNEHFLNCGIDGKGWQPPRVTVGQLIVVDLSEAIKHPDTPFKHCTPYISLFNKYADEFGIPPILLASIAMQESTCNPGAVGEGGEQGLMQISKDKCVNAPGGNCQDPNFNIREGASFFAQTLKDNDGNVLSTIGQYNGWKPDMTIAEATAAAHTSCCRCQNNLDYLFQLLNGWAQNIDPRERHMGIYQNLANC